MEARALPMKLLESDKNLLKKNVSNFNYGAQEYTGKYKHHVSIFESWQV